MDESNDVTKEKRGWILTAFIILMLFGSAINIIIAVISLIGTSDGSSLYIQGIVASVASAVLLIAIWKRKRWGCLGFIPLIIAGILFGIIMGTVSQSAIFSSVISIAVTYALYRSRKGYFE